MPAGRIWHRRSFRHSVCMIFHILNTKLEYALQPINRETVDLVEISRQAMSEVLNSELPEHAPVQ